jgi:hypothetical protein
MKQLDCKLKGSSLAMKVMKITKSISLELQKQVLLKIAENNISKTKKLWSIIQGISSKIIREKQVN